MRCRYARASGRELLRLVSGTSPRPRRSESPTPRSSSVVRRKRPRRLCEAKRFARQNLSPWGRWGGLSVSCRHTGASWLCAAPTTPPARRSNRRMRSVGARLQPSPTARPTRSCCCSMSRRRSSILIEETPSADWLTPSLRWRVEGRPCRSFGLRCLRCGRSETHLGSRRLSTKVRSSCEVTPRHSITARSNTRSTRTVEPLCSSRARDRAHSVGGKGDLRPPPPGAARRARPRGYRRLRAPTPRTPARPARRPRRALTAPPDRGYPTTGIGRRRRSSLLPNGWPRCRRSGYGGLVAGAVGVAGTIGLLGRCRETDV